MTRVCFFAHYDRDGHIDDYVVHYLKSLQKVCDRILFASDCSLIEGEESKLHGLAELVCSSRHGEYDFGSWKRCFEYMDCDVVCDELILANDSCYAPVYPFEAVFETRRFSGFDVWGCTATTNRQGEISCLHSYFVVIKKRVLDNSAFKNFMLSVTREKTKKDIVEKYEVGLTKLLQREGFTIGYISNEATGSTRFLGRHIHDLSIPWVKVYALRDNPNRVPHLINFVNSLQSGYPIHLIESHVLRSAGIRSLAHWKHSNSYFSPRDIKIPNTDITFFQIKLKYGWIKYYLKILGFPIPVMIINTRWILNPPRKIL